MPDLAQVRLPLYIALWVFSFVLLGLTAARLNHTGILGFYDPIVAELLVCSIFALLFAPFVLRIVHRYSDHPVLSHRPQTTEFVALAILWLFWIIGCGVASSAWPNLSNCQGIPECQLLSAMLGFAWLGWITITVLLFVESVPYISISRTRG